MIEELEVVCSNCSFPTVDEFNEDGTFKGFRIEPCTNDLEAALAEGWLDHGMGLVCPKCSLSYLADLERDREAGATNHVGGDGQEIVDAMVLRGLAPEVSEETIELFVQIFRTDRLNKLRALAGYPSITRTPVPKDEAQALEVIRLGDILKASKEKKDEPVPSPSSSNQ